ncbi:hypothetical protein ACIB24_05595 [Spongisporangium articulatum]|uniref:Uncharacterized protein n=1 Tax=Spongisporangium articulatum TaxID=3362603 RepID=A0ABW8AJJ4_9ACTN
MTLADEPLDVLASGREPDRRRRAAVAFLVVTVLALGVVGWAVDRHGRHAEFSALVACRDRAFAAIDDARGLTSSMAEYVRPSLNFDTGVSSEGLYGMVAHAAAPAVPALSAAEAGCRTVRVRAWHGAQTRARDVLLSYVGAEASLYRATAADGHAFYGANPTAGQRQAAAAAVDDARPGWLLVRP